MFEKEVTYLGVVSRWKGKVLLGTYIYIYIILHTHTKNKHTSLVCEAVNNLQLVKQHTTELKTGENVDPNSCIKPSCIQTNQISISILTHLASWTFPLPTPHHARVLDRVIQSKHIFSIPCFVWSGHWSRIDERYEGDKRNSSEKKKKRGNRRNKDLSSEKCMHGKMACMSQPNYCFVDHYPTTIKPTYLIFPLKKIQ